ncbi:MAG: hypothetical protein NVS3B14_15800 [Ktedonobacteraceae bacterium]
MFASLPNANGRMTAARPDDIGRGQLVCVGGMATVVVWILVGVGVGLDSTGTGVVGLLCAFGVLVGVDGVLLLQADNMRRSIHREKTAIKRYERGA